MEAPPGVACMDTRHPRRLLTSGQAQIPHPLIMTKPHLVKSASAEHLIAAIRTAVFDPKGENVVVGMPRGMLEKTETGPNGTVSARELEILLLAARGLSNRQIANKLTVAEGTVKRHLANAYNKMGVGSRGEAVRRALCEDWITIQEVTQEDG